MRRVTVPAQRLEVWLAGFAERHGETATESGPSEIALRGADGARAWLAVPFPPLAGVLLDHVLRPRRVGAILARRGGYAVGVFDGADLVASKVGSSYVQGTTKAGGQSQQRFARRRANQARAAFGVAADMAVRIVLPHAATLDAVVTGGDRGGVDAVLADDRLAPLRSLVTRPLIPVPDPRLRVLRALPEQYTAVHVRLDP